MASYTVRLYFNDGTNTYAFPHVYDVSDPKEGMKAVLIEGNRGDGSICIPGGKKSQDITVRGRMWDSDGYVDITVLMNEMRTKVTTNVATLSMQYWDENYSGGANWSNSWSYTVRRIEEISFDESLRLDIQEYEVKFIVLAY